MKRPESDIFPPLPWCERVGVRGERLMFTLPNLPSHLGRGGWGSGRLRFQQTETSGETCR